MEPSSVGQFVRETVSIAVNSYRGRHQWRRQDLALQGEPETERKSFKGDPQKYYEVDEITSDWR